MTQPRSCVCVTVLIRRRNEISVGPTLLSGLDVEDAVVTADALNTQVGFVDSILKAGSHYCLAVKENQNNTYDEIRYLFNIVHPDHIVRHEYQWETEHGRMEKRTVEAMSGKFLPKPAKEKWHQRELGTVLKVSCDRTIKASNAQSCDEYYFICSLPFNQYSIDKIGKIAQERSEVENKSHYILEVNFSQDRICCNNTNYLANGTALNNLATAIIYRYQEHLEKEGQKLSFRQIQCRLANPKLALEAVCVALGIRT